MSSHQNYEETKKMQTILLNMSRNESRVSHLLVCTIDGREANLSVSGRREVGMIVFLQDFLYVANFGRIVESSASHPDSSKAHFITNLEYLYSSTEYRWYCSLHEVIGRLCQLQAVTARDAVSFLETLQRCGSLLMLKHPDKSRSQVVFRCTPLLELLSQIHSISRPGKRAVFHAALLSLPQPVLECVIHFFKDHRQISSFAQMNRDFFLRTSVFSGAAPRMPGRTHIRTYLPSDYQKFSGSFHGTAQVILSNQGLDFCSLALSELLSLTDLDLSNNLISEIPPRYPFPPQLHVLSLAHNRLTVVLDLPDGLNLRKLDLSHNMNSLSLQACA